MTQLTEKEFRVLNSVSKIRDADVKLGDIIASLIGASCETGSPVNAANSSVSETMANATFNKGAGAVTVLSGGIDGTVASGMKFMADDDYMYFCPFGNTTADKNWRRVSLGSAY